MLCYVYLYQLLDSGLLGFKQVHTGCKLLADPLALLLPTQRPLGTRHIRFTFSSWFHSAQFTLDTKKESNDANDSIKEDISQIFGI